MTTISGFDELETIHGRLYMEENNALTQITAFEALNSINGELRIDHNDALEALPLFSALRQIGTHVAEDNSPIFIQRNRELSLCCGLFPFFTKLSAS